MCEQALNQERKMRNLINALLALTLLCAASVTLAFEPDPNDEDQLAAAKAILEIKKADPEIQKFFDESAGFAVFPSVGKGGIGIGGAYGDGLVIVGDKVVGKTTLTQVTIGLQLGGQVYSEFIFFKDDVALGNFKRGNYELGAQASAVAATAGASADADYDKGVAIFTNTSGGLMYEASVGGQKFKYEDVK
jgi:lipid-binding SYLF domain-containing protein